MSFAVGHLAFPEDEDDFEPLGAEGAESLMMSVAPLAIAVVVGPSPGAMGEREEGQLVDGGAQGSVTGEAEVDHEVFAAAHGFRHAAAVALQVPEGGPAVEIVAQFGPHTGDGRTGLADGQRAGDVSPRHAGEKLVDRLAVLGDGGEGGGE